MTARDFRDKARKCRMLADNILDTQAVAGLLALAADYEAKARVADGAVPDGDATPMPQSPPGPSRDPGGRR